MFHFSIRYLTGSFNDIIICCLMERSLSSLYNNNNNNNNNNKCVSNVPKLSMTVHV